MCFVLVQVVALDLVEGVSLWSFFPFLQVDSTNRGNGFKIWAKFLKLKTVPTQISLVISLAFENGNSELFVWTMDSLTGHTDRHHHKKSLRVCDYSIKGMSRVVGAMAISKKNSSPDAVDSPHAGQYILVNYFT
jgi:hypothetical protein